MDRLEDIKLPTAQFSVGHFSENRRPELIAQRLVRYAILGRPRWRVPGIGSTVGAENLLGHSNEQRGSVGQRAEGRCELLASPPSELHATRDVSPPPPSPLRDSAMGSSARRRLPPKPGSHITRTQRRTMQSMPDAALQRSPRIHPDKNHSRHGQSARARWVRSSATTARLPRELPLGSRRRSMSSAPRGLHQLLPCAPNAPTGNKPISVNLGSDPPSGRSFPAAAAARFSVAIRSFVHSAMARLCRQRAENLPLSGSKPIIFQFNGRMDGYAGKAALCRPPAENTCGR